MHKVWLKQISAWFNFHFLHISQSIFWDSAFQPQIQNFLGEGLVQPEHFRGAWRGNFVLQLSGLITPRKTGPSSPGSPRASKISIGATNQELQHPPGPWIREMRRAIQVLSQHGLCKQHFGKGIAGILLHKRQLERGKESTGMLDRLIGEK